MSHAPGTYLGGIRTLDDLMARCVVDPDTGCWHIRKANGKPFEPRENGQAPNVRLANGDRAVVARRAAWIFSRDWVPPKGYLIVSKCGCWDCIAPTHSTCITRARYGEITAKEGRLKTPARQAHCIRMARARASTKVTPELASWVRESEQSGVEIAHALAVSVSCVSSVKVGKSHRGSVLSGASVFGWRPAA